MNVWVVQRDDGTENQAEYSVDSVWTTTEAAHARGESLICPLGYRITVATLDPTFLLAAAC